MFNSVQIKEDFKMIQPDCKSLLLEWQRCRDKILTLAAERPLTALLLQVLMIMLISDFLYDLEVTVSVKRAQIVGCSFEENSAKT